jgi:hypothetical protein
MFAPLSQFQWRTNGAQWLAPLLNGASKKQWQKVPAISFFQQRAQWRPLASIKKGNRNETRRALTPP